MAPGIRFLSNARVPPFNGGGQAWRHCSKEKKKMKYIAIFLGFISNCYSDKNHIHLCNATCMCKVTLVIFGTKYKNYTFFIMCIKACLKIPNFRLTS